MEALDQTRTLARLMRSVSGLAVSLELEDPAVDRLIDALAEAENSLAERAPADPRPRVGPDPTDDATDDRRIYLDHSHDIGGYNPCFPEYAIEVQGDRAKGTVSFPLAFEGPPGLVHGGFLALFFDCVVQDHNCEVGHTGKTVSVAVEYHRPTPLLQTLEFEVDRSLEGRRIMSSARLVLDDVTLCSSTTVTVASERSRLPAVSPRRVGR